MHLYRMSFVVGFAAGYVVGTRAGREKYDQIVKIAKSAKENPSVQQTVSTLQTQATELLNTTGQKIADNAPGLMHRVEEHIPMLRHRDGHGASDGKSEASNGTFASTSHGSAGSAGL
jgi:hypothetical protein